MPPTCMSDPKDFFSLDPSPPQKAKAKSEKSPVITGVVPVKPENLRHRRLSWIQFVIAQLVIIMAIVAAAAWFYQTALLPHLQQPAAPSIPQPQAAAADTTALQASLSRATDQITALQKQIDAQRTERDSTQARLQEMADRMALVIKQTSFVPTADAARINTGDA